MEICYPFPWNHFYDHGLNSACPGTKNAKTTHCVINSPTFGFHGNNLYRQAVGLQWYMGVPVHHNIFLPIKIYEYHILNKLSRYLRHLHITNMAKCLPLVLPLPLFSPYARRFSKLTRKIVFSVISKMADTTCLRASNLGLSAVQTSEPMSKTRGKTLLVLLLT